MPRFTTARELVGSDYRFGEPSFRRFERDIADLVAQYPEPYVVRPRGLSCKTYVARIRDAIHAYLQSDWESNVDRTKLREIRPQVIFTTNGNDVYIGPPLGKSPLHVTTEAVVAVEPSSQINGANPDIVNALAVLKHHNILSPMPIHVSNITAEHCQRLGAVYPNVEIMHDSTNNSAIML